MIQVDRRRHAAQNDEDDRGSREGVRCSRCAKNIPAFRRVFCIEGKAVSGRVIRLCFCSPEHRDLFDRGCHDVSCKSYYIVEPLEAMR